MKRIEFEWMWKSKIKTIVIIPTIVIVADDKKFGITWLCGLLSFDYSTKKPID